VQIEYTGILLGWSYVWRIASNC